MKVLRIYLFLLLAVNLVACGAKPEDVASRIRWTGQSSVMIGSAGKTIYIDPWQLKEVKKADLILITHSHYDHLSIPHISSITGPDTVILAPEDCAAKIEAAVKTKVTVVEPGFSATVKGFSVEAVPAYNVIKTDLHPVTNKWVGYVITVDRTRIYHCGDTERVPEMKKIRADIMLVPLGQNYTMNSVQEAVDAVLDVKPAIAIPFHYGIYEGTAADADTFSESLKGRVRVMKMTREM